MPNPPAVPSSRARSLRAPSVSAVLGLTVAGWGALVGLRTLFDNSFFTHLATGRLILDGGGVPTADPYSYTAPGATWVVQSWLASVLYALADRIGDGAGVRVLTALLAAGIGLAVWVLTRPAVSLIGRLVVTSLVMVAGGAMWTSRPFMFGLVLLAVTLLVAEDRAPPWVLVPGYWIWANTHGSYPLGLLALAMLAAGRKLDGDDPRTELRAMAFAAGGTVASVASPLGPATLTFPLALLGKNEFLQKVVEWQSPNFGAGISRVFLIQVGLAIVLLVRKPSYRAAVPLVVFTAAALYAQRNIGVAGIVLVPGMARGIKGLGSVDGRERGPAVTVLAGVLVAAGLLVGSQMLATPAYDLSSYPVDALAAVEASYRPDAGSCRLLTEDTTGNVLELVHPPGRPDAVPVFLDDRYDMYPEAVMRDYLRLHSADPDWRDVLDRWDISMVVWNRGAPLHQLLIDDPGWRVAYTDARTSLLVRRDAERACRR